MIAATPTLFDTNQYDVAAENFAGDDWETPPEIAQKMAALVLPDEEVLEPFAGRGAIARYFKGKTIAIEIRSNRVRDGKVFAPNAIWHEGSFFAMPFGTVDVVCTNPPFSRAVEAIDQSLQWLNPNNPNARLLFLLPGDVFAAQERSDQLEALDCHIAHRYRIRGRVGYIKEGVRLDQRQVYDCVYMIKPGKVGATETVL